MPASEQARQLMCLREEFRAAFPWKRLTYKEFSGWARTERIPPINIPIRHWRPMRDGEPVPATTIEAFSGYIGDKKRIWPEHDCTLLKIAQPCELTTATATDRQGDAWFLGWEKLYAHIFRPFTLDDEAHCADEADLELAATMIYECEGWRHDRRLTGRQAVAFTERLIDCPLVDYAQALLTYWTANAYAVLFPTQRQGGTVQRVGVNVSLPVTEAFYRRFRQGLEREIVSSPEHTLPMSRYLYVAAMAEDINLDMKRGRARRSHAHFRNVLYQLASLAEPAGQNGGALHLIAAQGNKEIEKRAKAYGFRRLEATLPVSGESIIEFAPPVKEDLTQAAYLSAKASHIAMKGLIELYQSFVGSENREQE